MGNTNSNLTFEILTILTLQNQGGGKRINSLSDTVSCLLNNS